MITNRHGLAAVTIFIFLNYPRARRSRRDTAYPKSNFERLADVGFFGLFFNFFFFLPFFFHVASLHIRFSTSFPLSLSIFLERARARLYDVLFGLVRFVLFFFSLFPNTLIDVLINHYYSRCL